MADARLLCTSDAFGFVEAYMVFITEALRILEYGPYFHSRSTNRSTDDCGLPWWNSDAVDTSTSPREAIESHLSTPNLLTNPETDMKSEGPPDMLPREKCHYGFEGRYQIGNLTGHTGPKNRWEKHVDADDNGTQSCVSLEMHLTHEQGGQQRLEAPVWREPPSWCSQGMKETNSHTRTRALLRLLDEKHDHDHCSCTRSRVTRLRNVSPSILMATLRLLESSSASNPGNKHAISHELYGIIYIHKQSWCDVVATATYFIGQLACCLAMRNYELHHNMSAPHCSPSATSTLVPDKLWATLSSWDSDQNVLLSPLVKHYRSPSALLFVCVGLFYGTGVLLQYRLNRRDTYQYLSVPFGIINAGVVLSASTHSDCGGPKVASTIALCVSTAMILSVCMHGIWSTLVPSGNAIFRIIIKQWVRESALE